MSQRTEGGGKFRGFRHRLQPMDADLGFEGAEFRVAGHEFRVVLFRESRGERVSIGDFVPGFEICGLEHHGPHLKCLSKGRADLDNPAQFLQLRSDQFRCEQIQDDVIVFSVPLTFGRGSVKL